MGIDPAFGSSAFGIVIMQRADNQIQIMHAEEYILKFTFTSSVAQTSKLCEDRPTRPYSSAWITHRYWIPTQFVWKMIFTVEFQLL